MIKLTLRDLPKMEVLMEEISKYFSSDFSADWIKYFCNLALDKARDILKNQPDCTLEYNDIVQWIVKDIESIKAPSLKPVINATGITLHTNLGREVISETTFDAVRPVLTQYNTLEYNVSDGKRGSRYEHIEEKLCLLTGAEAALVVNNNASAVMLVLNSLAKDKEVVVSRGELVEIGGSFRVPEVMKLSGCHLVEIGTTNKTHLKDYLNAITEKTGLLLKVHTSNYRIVGFSESVDSTLLKSASDSRGIPIYEDLGSGLIFDLSKFGLTKEPLVKQVLQSGVDVVSFSGDKLFGGAQCGLIVGKKVLIDQMKRNQLLRAFRIDKFSLAIIDQTLIYYFNEQMAMQHIPVLETLSQSKETIWNKVNDFNAQYASIFQLHNLPFEIVQMKSEVGGGAMPLEQLDSFGLKLDMKKKASSFQRTLRNQDIPIIATVDDNCLYFDFRTIDRRQFSALFKGIQNALEGGASEK